MNFAYMKNVPDFTPRYTICCEAEEFALSKPNISVTSARKAMEYVVKLLEEIALHSKIPGTAVFFRKWSIIRLERCGRKQRDRRCQRRNQYVLFETLRSSAFVI